MRTEDINRLHYLIDKRGDQTSNLTKAEQAEYDRLREEYDQMHYKSLESYR